MRLLEPVDVAAYGFVNFAIGAIAGWIIDEHLFGTLEVDSKKEDHSDSQLRWRTVAQLVCVILAFNYLHKAIPYFWHPQGVADMDGGFAMSLGFAWTQRKLIMRFYRLTALQ